jgi:hypothetical protein
MSGRKQHHIPQSVLRGFETPSKGRTKKVWVFSKERKFKSPTADVAAERHFYSELSNDGSRTLDDLITDYEQSFGAQLTRLRRLSVGDVADSFTAAEVVAHLTIRNAHLRRSFVGGARLLAERATEVFCNESNLRAMLGVDGRQFPDSIAVKIDEHLASDPRYAATGLPRDLLHKIGFMVMKENFGRFVANHLPYMKLALDQFAEQAPEHLRIGHNKALAQGLAPDVRTAALSALHWSVRAAPQSGAILPDCVALGIEGDGRPQPLIMADLDKVSLVFIPLTPDRVLVGSRAGVASPKLAEFNSHAAMCSHDFFVSSRDGADRDELMAVVGARAQETVAQAIAFAFEGFKKNGTMTEVHLAPENGEDSPGPASEEAPAEALVLPPLHYEMSFNGVSDKETAHRIAAVLEGIIHELRPLMALDRLDGFTFAEDYEGALRNLDRGFKAPLLITTQEDYGVGVSMSPIILREGVVKSRIVARMWIGLGLISEKEDAQKVSLHLVINQLAHVACTQLLEESLPGFHLLRLEDGFNAFLYPCIAESWTGYFGARASAIFDSDSETAYRELVMSALRRAQETIPPARLAYRFDGDLDKLLATARPAITALLKHLGNLLGHCDGLRRSPFENAQLDAAFENAGLRGWADVFREDLALIWDRLGQWTSIDEFFFLNRHAERLLWHFGLFPRKTPDGKILVHVPLSTDAARLQGWRPIWRRLRQRLLSWPKRFIRAASTCRSAFGPQSPRHRA